MFRENASGDVIAVGVISGKAGIAADNLVFTDLYHTYLALPGQTQFTKTQPLLREHLDPVRVWWNRRESSEVAWTVSAAALLESGANLDRPNPARRSATVVHDSTALSNSLRGTVAGMEADLDSLLGRAVAQHSGDIPGVAPLGKALRHRSEFVVISDDQMYKRCRVQVRGQGVVLRDIVAGAQINTKRQQVCRPGELLVAEIDAMVGGFGLVPDDLAGAIVSSHYFLFEIDNDVLDSRYLELLLRTTYFQDQVRAQGSTNYAAIRPSHVLDYQVPLPDLPTQRSIVDDVTAVQAFQAKLNQASRDVATLADRIFLERIGVAEGPGEGA